MGVRQGAADLGANDARRLLDAACRDIRDARIAAGLSHDTVGRAAGLSASAYGRMERGEFERLPFGHVARAARAVGLAVSMRLYPAGSPVRDAGQLALESDFAGLLAGGLAFRPEVILPSPGDLRAWDGMVSSRTSMAFADCEMRLGDVQALLRRLEAKMRDDPRSAVLILVVRDSRHNRAVLAEYREVLRPLLPLDSPEILRALRVGRLPRASGLLLVRRQADVTRPASGNEPDGARPSAQRVTPHDARRSRPPTG